MAWSSQELSSAALYGNSNILQLHFSGLKEEFMMSQTLEAFLYRDYRDRKAATAGIKVRRGGKWRAKEALQVTESWLVGNVATG